MQKFWLITRVSSHWLATFDRQRDLDISDYRHLLTILSPPSYFGSHPGLFGVTHSTIAELA